MLVLPLGMFKLWDCTAQSVIRFERLFVCQNRILDVSRFPLERSLLLDQRGTVPFDDTIDVNLRLVLRVRSQIT